MSRDDEQRVVDADAEPDHRREHLSRRRQVDERGEERDRRDACAEAEQRRADGRPIAITEPKARRRMTIAASSPTPSALDGGVRSAADGISPPNSTWSPASTAGATADFSCAYVSPGRLWESASYRTVARAIVSSAEVCSVALGGGTTTWSRPPIVSSALAIAAALPGSDSVPLGGVEHDLGRAAGLGGERRGQQVGRLLRLDAGHRERVVRRAACDLADDEEPHDGDHPGRHDPSPVPRREAAEAVQEPRHGARLTAHLAFDTSATIFVLAVG